MSPTQSLMENGSNALSGLLPGLTSTLMGLATVQVPVLEHSLPLKRERQMLSAAAVLFTDFDEVIFE
jgi:hypothetical protein